MERTTEVKQTTAKRSATTRKQSHQKIIKGPYSRIIDRGAVGRLNGNTSEAKFLKAYEARLIEHVGGSPSITQQALITRTARLALHLELMDERSLGKGQTFGETDHHYYIAWSNSLARHLEKLGFTSAWEREMARLGQ